MISGPRDIDGMLSFDLGDMWRTVDSDIQGIARARRGSAVKEPMDATPSAVTVSMLASWN